MSIEEIREAIEEVKEELEELNDFINSDPIEGTRHHIFPGTFSRDIHSAKRKRLEVRKELIRLNAQLIEEEEECKK